MTPLLAVNAFAASGSCPIPVASDVAMVDWPPTAGWSRAELALPAGQTFNYSNNLPGYSNAVTVRRIGAPEFSSGPELYVRTYPFTTAAGPLSDRTIDYMDYLQLGEVSYTFDQTLSANDGILVMDVDLGETIDIEFFDESDNLLPTVGWSAALIRSVATPPDPANGELTTGVSAFTIVGTATNVPDPTWLFTPPAGQQVKRMVITGLTGGAGSWDINFAHGGCVIEAADDDFSGTPVPVAGGSTTSVLVNDTLNGGPVVPGDVNTTLVDNGGIAGLTIDANGVLSVPPGSTGAFSVTYQICALASPTLCDTATVALRVAQPAAVDDSSLGNSTGSVVAVNVLANDLSTGGPVIVPGSVQIVGAPGDGRSLAVAGEGTWTVNPTTGAITFTPLPAFVGQPTPIQYTMADNLGNVSNAATVLITYFRLDAANDDFSGTPVPVAGGSTTSVLVNDTLNGNPVVPGDVNTTLVDNGGLAGLTIDANGVLSVPPGSTMGAYTATYQICALASPALCDTAVVALRVAQPAAVDDSSVGNSTGSVVAVNVLANDLSTGGPVIVPASVQIVGAPGDGRTLEVAGEGTWTVNPATGAITFTPLPSFLAQPTPIQYTVADSLANVSNQATVRITYLAPVAAIPSLTTWGMLLLVLSMSVLARRQGRVRAFKS